MTRLGLPPFFAVLITQGMLASFRKTPPAGGSLLIIIGYERCPGSGLSFITDDLWLRFARIPFPAEVPHPRHRINISVSYITDAYIILGRTNDESSIVTNRQRGLQFRVGRPRSRENFLTYISPLGNIVVWRWSNQPTV